MCKFKPFNKHLLVEKVQPTKKQSNSSVLIPEEAIQEDRYGLVRFVCAAKDCDKSLINLNSDTPWWASQTGTSDDQFTSSARENKNISLIVENTMIENIKFNDEEVHIVHQNYVVGILDNDKE